MRKLFALFIICAVLLYSIMLCYADEQAGIKKDLPLAMKFETKQTHAQLEAFSTEAEAMLAEQQLNINTLSAICYMGYDYAGSFDGRSLERSISRKISFNLNAPIYKSEIYKGYYNLRTERLLKQHSTSQAFNYEAVTKAARQEFDNYMKTAVKGEAAKGNLAILLQEKLMDKLVELEPNKRKAALEEIYSLRLPENASLYQDYLYQIFEYGVRTELLNQMLEINREKLTKLAHDIPIMITAERNGRLLLQNKADQDGFEVVEVLNTATEGNSYNGITVLSELYGKLHFTFIDDISGEHLIDIDKVLEAISLDDEGYLQLKLGPMLEQGQTDVADPSKVIEGADAAANLNDMQIKALEASYKNKAIEAQGIIKELNRYSMYLELKNKGLSNSFTRKFEDEKKSWKATLETKLNRFGPGGMADFAAYIKQFVLMSRSGLGQSDKGKILIARFRNSIVQFRQPDDSSVWITDMLYNIKYMK